MTQIKEQTIDHLGNGAPVIDDPGSDTYILPAGGSLSGALPGFGHGIGVDQSGALFGAKLDDNLDSWPAGTASSTIKASGFAAAAGVPTDNAGDAIVADHMTGRLCRLPASGGDVLLASDLSTSIRFSAITKGGGTVYVSDQNNNEILSYPLAGGSATEISTGSYTLDAPGGLALDGADVLFIADTNNNRIIAVPGNGSGPSVLSTGGVTLNGPLGLATDAAGNIYEADASAVSEICRLQRNCHGAGGAAH